MSDLPESDTDAPEDEEGRDEARPAGFGCLMLTAERIGYIKGWLTDGDFTPDGDAMESTLMDFAAALSLREEESALAGEVGMVERRQDRWRWRVERGGLSRTAIVCFTPFVAMLE